MSTQESAEKLSRNRALPTPGVKSAALLDAAAGRALCEEGFADIEGGAATACVMACAAAAASPAAVAEAPASPAEFPPRSSTAASPAEASVDATTCGGGGTGAAGAELPWWASRHQKTPPASIATAATVPMRGHAA